MEKQPELRFDYGTTREQACIMCHLSSGCPRCCEKCRREGRNGACYGQSCLAPDRDFQWERRKAWMHIVTTSPTELARFVPGKYLKAWRRREERLKNR